MHLIEVAIAVAIDVLVFVVQELRSNEQEQAM